MWFAWFAEVKKLMKKTKISEKKMNSSMLCSICIYSTTVASFMKQHQSWYITLVSIIINNAYHHNHNLTDKLCSARWQILLCHVILSECCGFAQRTIDVITNMVLKTKLHVEHNWNRHLSGFDCTWLGSYQRFEPWVEQMVSSAENASLIFA